MGERIREAVARITVPSPSGAFTLTVSVGGTVLDGADETWSDSVQRADYGLYRSKAGGRNRVSMVAPGDPAAPVTLVAARADSEIYAAAGRTRSMMR